MAFLRHSTRHIHATVVKYLEDELDGLGWFGPTTPFGAEVIRTQTFFPPESELATVTPGLVAITMGDELDAEEGELGGPLHRQEFPFFVHCFMSKDAYAVALATDVRDILRGRTATGQRVLDLLDFTDATPAAVDGWSMEITEVERDRMDRLPIYWQLVSFTLVVDFAEELF